MSKQGNIINLDEMINRRMPIQLNGKTYHLKELTMRQFRRMVEIEGMENTKGAAAQMDFLAEVLSNNQEGVAFTVDALLDLQRTAIVRLWTALIARTLEVANDPNS
uniref:hypothetical protein n=1 Tax=Ndongobacter massiliensis TaxID=1871025 RepID=UPI000930FF49|nr:hypothetical protein [Ndongobacter massiliensis]